MEEYTISEIATHNKEGDCWVILHGEVIDLSAFMYNHPAGIKPLLKYAGKDCTMAFLHVHHSKRATELVKNHVIGKVKTTTEEEVI